MICGSVILTANENSIPEPSHTKFAMVSAKCLSRDRLQITKSRLESEVTGMVTQSALGTGWDEGEWNLRKRASTLRNDVLDGIGGVPNLLV